MAKFMIAFAALVATSAAQSFKPLKNPGAQKCIIEGAYNEDADIYSLKTGACNSPRTVEFKFLGSGKALKTSDGYCLSTAKPSPKANTKLILDECLNKAPGQKWTKVGKNQWRNGYRQCIDMNGSTIVQKSCKTLATDNWKSRQQWVFVSSTPLPPVTPPAAPEIQCNAWHLKYNCPAYWTPVYNLKCVGAKDQTCQSVCCKKPPQQTCYNSGVKCGYDFELKNAYCGNYGYPACDFKQCCQKKAPEVTTCFNWGQCKYGFQLVEDSRSIKCQLSGRPSNYGPERCSNDLCCEPRAPPKPFTCQTWSNRNSCKYGFDLISNPASVQCDPSIRGDCFDACCVDNTPKPGAPITCSEWNGSCQNGPIDNPFYVTCRPGVQGECQQKCCKSGPQPGAPIKCSAWNGYCPNGPIDNSYSVSCRPSVQGECQQNCCKTTPPPADKVYCDAFQCADGYIRIPNAISVEGDDSATCCRRDTCKLWMDRLVDESNASSPRNSEAVCANAGLENMTGAALNDGCASINGVPMNCDSDKCCVPPPSIV